MPRFSANISMMFTEHPVLDRMGAARDAGFGAVEIQFPYDVALDTFAGALSAAGMPLAVMNFPVGDLLEGGPGLAAMPGREKEFQAGVVEARRYAEVLRPRNVNVIVGWPPATCARDDCMAALVANLRHAAAAMSEIGVGVTVEPVNTRDRPGYFLPTSREGIAAIDAAEHENLRIEYDLYHMQIMEGDLVPTLERLVDRIGHIQFADTPGRHEPGTGEINFANVFAALDRIGYDGWVGAEYNPSGRTEDSLGWLKPYL
ncbi:MAG: hydroxypyruvate isomerase family protein [Alphaproteobacteria bacterium]